MASNFSMVPIRWLFTVDFEMAFFLFNSRAEAVLKCLFSFKTHSVEEKIIAKLVNCKVNFTGKTDVARFVIHAILVFSVKI